ncbi:uncharacterized protein LACBIDRAFT_336053 [Laccaria bicolor S238N-H82]|uniref:Predicted protein n=1 Tax=Laccaria bicolor (strain S238N-H82 / ATCC MYA-4686) TaxID=486041 RepID=B0DS20_LACBS|nr:uncharacterized protein LACBIDRAFT_295389 [Laccaria bicolor S238N-H82]XP_001891008.1 uncharacterized protein LACBIDRAFT_336053 [Laccaria bicolor S238N-H82]EDQ98343.1 predicted protein [Laccaria bicolor S238N-H82]EDR02713.1 predicted protein [Laccaria bicolor S238N-H82]|eukprot:XP_001886757.1 predicted protein [Laccaria bicolor S238N-H82]
MGTGFWSDTCAPMLFAYLLPIVRLPTPIKQKEILTLEIIRVRGIEPRATAIPTSPRDPRYYIPRRPSPLSLPPLAPHMAFQGPSTHHVTFQAPSHGFQAFAALAVPNTAHEQGGRVYKEPRYPLEAQRRFLSEARKALNEVKRDKDEEQPKSPCQTLPPPSPTTTQQQPKAQSSPTLTLPLTPLSGASTVSQYSQLGDEDDHETQEKRKGGVFCCIVPSPQSFPWASLRCGKFPQRIVSLGGLQSEYVEIKFDQFTRQTPPPRQSKICLIQATSQADVDWSKNSNMDTRV